jgi:hypothetical protein
MLGLGAGEHDRHPGRPLGPLDALHVRQFDAQHLEVEEEERAECLVLRRGGDGAVGGEVREELADLVRAHLCGVALAVVEDEALDPVDVGALGADAIMVQPQAPPHLLEKGWSFGHGWYSGWRRLMPWRDGGIMRGAPCKSREFSGLGRATRYLAGYSVVRPCDPVNGWLWRS